MAWLEGVRGALLDVDGTLLIGGEAVPGAASALRRLRDRGIRYRITTNTTRRPRAGVAAVLRRAGIEVESDEILNPAVLARRRILDSGRLRAALLVPDESRADFDGVEVVRRAPDWVVVGDLGRGFTWDRLNEAFGWLREGAGFLALHKNRYWHAGGEGPVLDAGAWVAGLEYAAAIEAEVVGKPSPEFFALALAALGLGPGEVLVVGDDVTTDGRGGAAAGCRTAAVRTGKFDERDLERERFRPDLLLDSVADLLA